MLTISKPLSASQVCTYHEREFASERQNYWSRDQQGHREWHGKLAEQWGLEGSVGDEHFARLTEGQHPYTETQLVRHQASKTYEGKFGQEVTSVEHRAGWDATFSAPKSVSLTALVGGDERVREAHRVSVRVALAELERYTQARIGNVHAPETTGKFFAWAMERKFELRHIQPGKPTQNAHVESFHARLREECLRVNWFTNLFDARRKVTYWRKEYNEERPNSSLGYRTPAGFALACGMKSYGKDAGFPAWKALTRFHTFPQLRPQVNS
jgi:hypothetical protein